MATAAERVTRSPAKIVRKSGDIPVGLQPIKLLAVVEGRLLELRPALQTTCDDVFTAAALTVVRHDDHGGSVVTCGGRGMACEHM